MQIINVAAASAVVLSGYAAAQTTFMVNTPSSLVQCQPYLLTWTGGVAPYFPRITQPGVTSSIIENFPQTNEMQYSWTVDQPVGQKVTVVIGDSTGATADSGQSPSVAAGSSSSCLSNTSSASSTSGSSTAAASSSSSSRSSSSSSSSSSMAATSTSSTGAATSMSSSSAPAATTSAAAHDGAATLRGFAAVVAGTVGVVVAALL